MSIVTVRKTINAPITRAWEALAEFGEIHRFHPLVKQSPLLGGASRGVGAQRRCDFHDGNHIVEEVTGYDEGRSLAVSIVEGSMPLRRAEAVIEVRPVDAERTEVSFTMDYTPKYGPLGVLMDRLMMRRQFTSILARVIDGLETHLQTGGWIDEKGQPLPATVAA